MSHPKTVILAGSGHAHLEVMKALSPKEISAHRFLLVSPDRDTYYSGLVPSLISGEIDSGGLIIHSAEYAEAKGFRFIQDSVVSFSESENSVTFASGSKEKFDILSLNVGGTLAVLPSESPKQTIYLRPFGVFLPRWREVEEIFVSSVRPRVVVVGGGAAAVEVATALKVRLDKLPTQAGEVHLVAKGPRLCESYSVSTSEAILRSLQKLGIRARLNQAVETIGQGRISLAGGEPLEFDTIFVVIPTGPSALTSRKIDSTLRLSRRIFAVGDGAQTQGTPSLPRSGVIAVRQGQHLVESIRRLLRGEQPLDFAIPPRQLNILISGEKVARAVWGDFSIEGRLPLRIKRWIDGKYMKSFIDRPRGN